MNDINELVLKVKEALDNDALIIEFRKAKMLVENDLYIVSLEKNIKAIQQAITRSVMDKTKHAELIEKYQELKKEYEGHPYVVNYNSLLSDVNDLLYELKTIIE